MPPVEAAFSVLQRLCAAMVRSGVLPRKAQSGGPQLGHPQSTGIGSCSADVRHEVYTLGWWPQTPTRTCGPS